MDLTTSEYNKLYNIARNICKNNNARELLHESLVAMYKYPTEKLEFIKEDGKLFFFMARIMANMYHSKTSQYYYKIKRFYKFHVISHGNDSDKDISTNTYDNRIELIEDELNKLYWYDREVFKLYYFGDNNGKTHSFTSLSKMTGISRKSLFNTVKNVREHLKDKFDGFERDV